MPSDTPDLAAKLDALIAGATPGPWRVRNEYNEVTDGWPVLSGCATVALGCYLGGTDPAKANANLLALSPLLAAVAREVPDLIDMAASYLNICPDRHGHSVETLNRARASLAALAKEIDNG